MPVGFTQIFRIVQQNHCCRKDHLDRIFGWSGSERLLLQDEDPPGSRPHSFPGCYQKCSEMSPGQSRSGPDVVGSEETHQCGRGRLKCNFAPFWTPGTASFWLSPQFHLMKKEKRKNSGEKFKTTILRLIVRITTSYSFENTISAFLTSWIKNTK